ncbi:MAG: hypothetical protein EZS28_054847, partial [Streblomastix strix]
MCADLGLNLDYLIAMSIDGAASMIGSHRLNIVALDAIKRIQLHHLRTTEAVTQQLWHNFTASSLHAAILAQIHCLNEDGQVKLKRLVPTRWLSCYDSVTATINELTSIWIALNQIWIERRD